jgi:hypothetical protein
MGARLNAYTSREQTTFFADVQGRDVPAALDVLSDILQHPRFPQQAIQRERGVILREMEEVSCRPLFPCTATIGFLNEIEGKLLLSTNESCNKIP